MFKILSAIFMLLLVHSLAAADTELLIVYSNNTNGLLENCHCPDHAYGALEKRASLIDSLRRKFNNVLVLDAGDLLDIRKNQLLHSYVLRAYAIMGYDAISCGDQDFVEGVEFFSRLAADPRLPLVSSNILIGTDPVGRPYIIKNFEHIRVGITGTINPGFYKYLPADVKTRVRFTDQYTSLQAVLNTIIPRSDLIILLSHSGYERDIDLAAQFPEIDIIIGGHSQTLLAEPDLRGNTYIVQTGENGYRLGVLTLRFSADKLISLQNQLILLDEKVGNNPEIMELIDSYHRQIPQKKR